MTKLLTIYFDGGDFSQIFDAPSGKTMDGSPKKFFGPKMMARTTSYHHAKFGGNRATHVGVRGRNVIFHFVFFENTLHGRRPVWCVVDLLPEDIASTFVGRFRRCLHRFFAEEKRFSAH